LVGKGGLRVEFHKDLSHVGWEKVQERQMQRLPLVAEWASIMSLKKGTSLLDIGPGPGVFLNEYASIVGSEGKIIALEKSQVAIQYCLKEMNHSNVRFVCWDAEKPFNDDLGNFNVITLTDVLHHADSPQAILKNVHNRATEDTLIFIAEFDSEAQGKIGPPLDKRIAISELKLIITSVGLEVVREGKQDFEHYYFLIKKQAKAPQC
jgi:2-polyprenyl-3-methyl-5-hydroxy-6-metoxy-1,4-benzoquinol methylase